MTRKSFYIGLIVVMAAYAILISNAKAECVKVGANLGLTVPCSAVGADHVGFAMDFFSNSLDPDNLYWALDLSSLSVPAQTENCVTFDTTDLSLSMPCAEFGGTHFEFTLQPWNNPNDTASFYWQMDLTSVEARSGSQLFVTNCGACHTANGLGSGSVGDRTGRTASQIQTAIANTPSMSGLSGLTTPEIMAISDAITP